MRRTLTIFISSYGTQIFNAHGILLEGILTGYSILFKCIFFEDLAALFAGIPRSRAIHVRGRRVPWPSVCKCLPDQGIARGWRTFFSADRDSTQGGNGTSLKQEGTNFQS